MVRIHNSTGEIGSIRRRCWKMKWKVNSLEVMGILYEVICVQRLQKQFTGKRQPIVKYYILIIFIFVVHAPNAQTMLRCFGRDDQYPKSFESIWTKISPKIVLAQSTICRGPKRT